MVSRSEDALRAEEVADILKVGRNKVYDMAKNGELRSYRVGRKLRFTYSDVQSYISASSSGGQKTHLVDLSKQTPDTTRQFTVCGQDILVETLVDKLRKRDFQIAQINMNSYDALYELHKGHIDAACCHLIDTATGKYNESSIRHLVPGTSCVSFRLAMRTQGFIVKKDNPKNILTWKDLRRSDVRLANRDHGSGARALLDYQLQKANVPAARIKGYQSEYSNEAAAAVAVVQGLADVALGRLQAATQFEGLEFLPLHQECYDLVMKEETLRQPEAQGLVALLAGNELRNAFSTARGYNLSEMGRYTLIRS